VVFATNPFREDDSAGYPFLVINDKKTPFQADQCIILSLTTLTCQGRTDSTWTGALDRWRCFGVEFNLPWLVNMIKTERIYYRQGALHEDDGRVLLSPQSPVNPTSICATTKLAADFLTMNYNDAYGLPTVTTRMFNN
jgi:hypothetical protein